MVVSVEKHTPQPVTEYVVTMGEPEVDLLLSLLGKMSGIGHNADLLGLWGALCRARGVDSFRGVGVRLTDAHGVVIPIMRVDPKTWKH